MRIHLPYWPHATKAFFVTVAATLICACGTARVRVRPEPVSVTQAAAVVPTAISLSVDEYVATYQTVARSSLVLAAGPGYGAIEAAFDLGTALDSTVEQVMRAHFREITRSTECAPGSRLLLRVAFAKPPEIRIRWVQRMASEGGGATVDLALSVTAQRCGGPVVWRSIATGYGTADRIDSNFMWTTPAAEQFRPAADAALTDLAHHLDSILSAAAQKELAELLS